MEHVSIILKLVALMTGILTISYIYQSYKIYNSSILKFYLLFCLFLNLMLFISLTSLYSSVNILENYLAYKSTTLAYIITHIVSYFFIIMISFLISVFISLFEITLTRSIKTIIYLGFMVITLSYVIGFILRSLNLYCILFPILYFSFIGVGHLVLFLFLIFFLIKGFNIKESQKKRIILSFGIFYLIGFAFLLFGSFLPNSVKIIFHPGFMLVFNLAPYMGVKYLILPYLRLSLTKSQGIIILDSLSRKYKISKREREIAELILLGKSNREIQNQLYISLNTVKNHIYHLYQKIGVNSRGQLIHFILKFGK